MALEPTYAEYAEWGGVNGEEAFRASLPRARAVVRYLVGRKAVHPDLEADYREAVCAAIDALLAHPEGGASFSIGGFSMSAQATAVSKSAEGAAIDAAKLVLAPTGLLYSGVA